MRQWASACGAKTDFGAAIRHSEANPKAMRDLPTQELARTQFYLDLYVDDVKLLVHLIEKLGNEPAREEQAIGRTARPLAARSFFARPSGRTV